MSSRAMAYIYWVCSSLLLLPGISAAAESGNLSPGLVNPGYEEKPGWFKESFLDIREDIAEAAAENRQLMLYFYQDGCPYCAKLLQDNFADREISSKTQKYFDTIAINIWGDREVVGLQGEALTEKQLASNLKVQFTPTLLFLDGQGRVLTRLNGYYPPHKLSAILDYLGDKSKQTQTFTQYYASLNPRVASGKLHRESFFLTTPLNLIAEQRNAGRPLLVLFEQQQCAACDELHQQVLGKASVAASISAFDVAQVDIWSKALLTTPSGEKLSAKNWARQMQIQYTPSLVFFNAQGKEVFRSEAYLRSFHLQAALDYVATAAYQYQTNFQRFIQHRAEVMAALGIEVDLMQ